MREIDDMIKEDGVPSPTPLSFLRSLFASSARGQQLLAQPRQTIFRKPCQAEIDCYDLESVQAIQASDVDKLRSMVREGKSMNASNRYGESLFAMACRRGSVEVVRFLIHEAKVRLDIQDDYGRTPLHDACWTALPNMVCLRGLPRGVRWLVHRDTIIDFSHLLKLFTQIIMDELLKVVPPAMLLTEDVRGHTPFHYARKEHWVQWENFLKSRSPLILHRLATEAFPDQMFDCTDEHNYF